MKIVVDTNILFSLLLNAKGKIGDLIFNSSGVFGFYAANYLKEEIQRHNHKLLDLSKLNEAALTERKSLVFSQIRFLDELLIPEHTLLDSEKLVSDIDPNDTVHVAFTLYLNSYLWTGDKKLITGLREKGFSRIISADELWELRTRILNTG